MALLHGAELNIGRDGGLDYDAAFRRTLEWCVAGVHSHFDLDRDEQTRRMLAAMEDPTVHAIAHLTGRRIGRRPGIELDVDAVLQKAVETGTAIEINAALGRLDAIERGALPGPRPGRDVRHQHRHAPHPRARAHGVGRAAGDARLRRSRSYREPVAPRAIPRLGAQAPGAGPTHDGAALPRLPAVPGRLLGQARPAAPGRRRRRTTWPGRLRDGGGVELGEAFAFVSSLYFRGKLAYARAFARPPEGLAGAHVITPCDGLRPPDSRLTLGDLQRYAGVPVDPDEKRYTRPLLRDLRGARRPPGRRPRSFCSEASPRASTSTC